MSVRIEVRNINEMDVKTLQEEINTLAREISGRHGVPLQQINLLLEYERELVLKQNN